MCAPIIGLALGGLSAVTAMMGANMQSEAQARALEARAAEYKAQSEMQARQAVLEQVSGQQAARRRQDQVATLGRQQLVSYASTGLSLGSGSIADTVSDTAREGALDVAAIEWNAKLKYDNFAHAARLSAGNSATALNAAEYTRDNSWISAASAGLSAGMSGFGGGSAIGTSLANAFKT